METRTHVFHVEGMHCGSCALLIDDVLEDLPGVVGSQTTKKQGRCVVDLDASRTGPDAVIHAIGELGYRASPLP